MAKIVSRQPVDFTGCGDSISQKRQDISGTNKQSAGLAERADSRLYQRGKTAEERHGEQTRSSNMEARAICQHSLGHTRSVKKGLQRQSLSLWFLSASLLCISIFTTTSHPPNNIHSHSSPFLLLWRETCRLEEEGQ